MYELDEIKSRSFSSTEIVVKYTDAIELLHLYEQAGVRVLGWEGWLQHPDGTLGHSRKFQGTTDLSNLSSSSSIALCKTTIMQANSESHEIPEVEGAELLFCISEVGK